MIETHVTHSVEETHRLGKALARDLKEGTVITLIGGLGRGKTCLAQGICTGLGARQPVTSPSFTIVNEYQGRLPIYHIDFYRLAVLEEVEEIGWEEYVYGSGVCLVEWADKVKPLLPDCRIDIYMDLVAGHPQWRKITVRRT